MGAGTPPLIEAYPSGSPRVVAAGRAVSLTLFIPADAEVSGKKIEPLHRHRTRVITGNDRKPFAQMYPDKRSVAWEDHVAQVARMQVLQTPVEGDTDFVLPFKDMRILMSLRFNLPKPVSYPKRVTQHLKKPDIDNYAKCLVDGLVKGRLIEDDGLITDLVIAKRYIEPGHPQGVEIELVALPAEVV